MISLKSREARRASHSRDERRSIDSARLLALGFALLLVAAPGRQANAEPELQRDESVEEIVVKGQQPASPDTFAVSPSRATPNAPDTAELVQLVPGAAVVNNGPLAGQVQYRGMFGDRVSVRIDDAVVTTGGPNWMDPPLHYAPRVLVESLEVKRGIASVSEGPETIGSSAQVHLKSSHFGDDSRFQPMLDLQLSGRSVDSSVTGGGLVGVANDAHRFHLLGSAEVGDNVRVSGGRLRPTEFERYQFGAGYGLRLGEDELGVDYRYNDTHSSGNPALPMDTRYVRTHLGKLSYQGELGDVSFDSHFSASNVDHRMDNFRLRSAPMASMFRTADAEVDAYGLDLRGLLPIGGGELRFGGEGHWARHDMDVSDPNNAAFFVTNFNDVRRDRYSLFAQWSSELGDIWSVEGGIRYSLVATDAGKVDALPAQPLPPPVGQLRDRFNAADRDKFDHLLDVVAKLAVEPWEGWRFDLGVARKTRAPSYIERYAWIPLEVTGGLADGNNYVGDIDLDQEVAYEFDAGVEWRWGRFYLAPRAFYRRVNDYIQGVPSSDLDVKRVSAGNGDTSPLQYSNVSAEFYGFDTPYAVLLPFDFQLDGVLSFTRGERRDTDDDLYRIAPINGRTTLTYLRDSWSIAVEAVYAGRQNKVSDDNDETTTDARGAMNLFATWEPVEGLALAVGVDNVLNGQNVNHLSGTSRVTSSGAEKGERLPSAGRSFYGRISARF